MHVYLLFMSETVTKLTPTDLAVANAETMTIGNEKEDADGGQGGGGYPLRQVW